MRILKWRLFSAPKMCVLKIFIIFCTYYFLKDHQPKDQTTIKEKPSSRFLKALNEDTGTSTDYKCTNDRSVERDGVEDVLCLPRLSFLNTLKSPCWNSTNDEAIHCLPYFHVIGSPGTAIEDLYLKIAHHPQVFSVDTRALNGGFWSKHRYKAEKQMTLEEFGGLFKYPKTNRPDMVSGYFDAHDFSSTQLWWKYIQQNNLNFLQPEFTTTHLIRHVQPSTKFILMLRHPADRLFDHYMNQEGRRRNVMDFHRGVLKSIHELNACVQMFTLRTCVFSQPVLQALQTPIVHSLYDVHLQEWLSVFPREQFFILRHEDFVKSPSHVISQISEFLGVDKHGPWNEYWRKSVLSTKTHNDRMREETRNILNNFFQPRLKELKLLLQDPIFTWDDDV